MVVRYRVSATLFQFKQTSFTCFLTLLRSSDSASPLHQPLLSIHFRNLVIGSLADLHSSISSTGRYLVESSDVEWCPTRYVRAWWEKDQKKHWNCKINFKVNPKKVQKWQSSCPSTSTKIGLCSRIAISRAARTVLYKARVSLPSTRILRTP